MLRGDQETLCQRSRVLGLVAGDRGGLTAALARARSLRARGWQVRVLGIEPSPGVEALPWDGLPLVSRVTHAHGDGPCEASERLRRALEILHARSPFDVLEFPTQEGLGYRAIQAKRAGLAFADCVLAVRLDGTATDHRQKERPWPDCPADLEGVHAERYALEHACVRVQEGREEPSLLPGPVPPPATSIRPLVTVCVPHFNLGQHLPETLASLAAQSYPHLEVIVIDDGSTDAASRAAVAVMQERYPDFRFLHQTNAGIGATRNRGLREARGEYFLPMDADNVACPELVDRLVRALHGRPGLAAVTCYFVAFATDADRLAGRFLYAYRPSGGPHVLGCVRNVYGDATALYRVQTLRAIGGWETDRGTSYEDWEAFVKLVHAGHHIDVVPEHLFYYRHLPTGFSRVTDSRANHERVLRQFRRREKLSAEERELLWDYLAGLSRRVELLEARQQSRRYRVADRLHAAWRTLRRLSRGERRAT